VATYVNEFNQFGRTWQVVVQTDDKVRKRVDELKQKSGYFARPK